MGKGREEKEKGREKEEGERRGVSVRGPNYVSPSPSRRTDGSNNM